MKDRKCIVCGKNRIEEIEQVISKIRKIKIARCISCGLAFQNPIPTKRNLKKFYDEIYSGKYNLKSTEDAFSNYDEKQEEGRIKEIEKFKKRGRLLDVGASSGFFLRKLRENKNFIGYGTEYSKSAAISAINYGLNIKIGEITTVDFPEHYFDVITMHSVLEHIPDLNATIRSARRKLKKGGLFVFNVPNISSFEFMLYKFLKKSFVGFIYEHIYYFTPKSIKILLERNGFEILLMTSRHHSTLRPPSPRPLIGLATFIPKLFLEYTDFGGRMKLGNILYTYAKVR